MHKSSAVIAQNCTLKFCWQGREAARRKTSLKGDDDTLKPTRSKLFKYLNSKSFNSSKAKLNRPDKSKHEDMKRQFLDTKEPLDFTRFCDTLKLKTPCPLSRDAKAMLLGRPQEPDEKKVKSIMRKYLGESEITKNIPLPARSLVPELHKPDQLSQSSPCRGLGYNSGESSNQTDWRHSSRVNELKTRLERLYREDDKHNTCDPYNLTDIQARMSKLKRKTVSHGYDINKEFKPGGFKMNKSHLDYRREQAVCQSRKVNLSSLVDRSKDVDKTYTFKQIDLKSYDMQKEEFKARPTKYNGSLDNYISTEQTVPSSLKRTYPLAPLQENLQSYKFKALDFNSISGENRKFPEPRSIVEREGNRAKSISVVQPPTHYDNKYSIKLQEARLKMLDRNERLEESTQYNNVYTRARSNCDANKVNLPEQIMDTDNRIMDTNNRLMDTKSRIMDTDNRIMNTDNQRLRRKFILDKYLNTGRKYSADVLEDKNAYKPMEHETFRRENYRFTDTTRETRQDRMRQEHQRQECRTSRVLRPVQKKSTHETAYSEEVVTSINNYESGITDNEAKFESLRTDGMTTGQGESFISAKSTLPSNNTSTGTDTVDGTKESLATSGGASGRRHGDSEEFFDCPSILEENTSRRTSEKMYTHKRSKARTIQSKDIKLKYIDEDTLSVKSSHTLLVMKKHNDEVRAKTNGESVRGKKKAKGQTDELSRYEGEKTKTHLSVKGKKTNDKKRKSKIGAKSKTKPRGSQDKNAVCRHRQNGTGRKEKKKNADDISEIREMKDHISSSTTDTIQTETSKSNVKNNGKQLKDTKTQTEKDREDIQLKKTKRHSKRDADTLQNECGVQTLRSKTSTALLERKNKNERIEPKKTRSIEIQACMNKPKNSNEDSTEENKETFNNIYLQKELSEKSNYKIIVETISVKDLTESEEGKSHDKHKMKGKRLKNTKRRSNQPCWSKRNKRIGKISSPIKVKKVKCSSDSSWSDCSKVTDERFLCTKCQDDASDNQDSMKSIDINTNPLTLIKQCCSCSSCDCSDVHITANVCESSTMNIHIPMLQNETFPHKVAEFEGASDSNGESEDESQQTDASNAGDGIRRGSNERNGSDGDNISDRALDGAKEGVMFTFSSSSINRTGEDGDRMNEGSKCRSEKSIKSKSRLWNNYDADYLQQVGSKKWYHFCFKP